MTAYLDHAATTPMLPVAIEALTAELGRTGNASSLHSAGRTARRTVEESREQLAAALGARPSEVVLTAGGTEADNLAIKGLFWSRATQDPARRRILVSAVEHHAVLDPAFWMAEHAGAEIVLLPVDAEGRLDVDALAAELDASAAQTALLSVMWANNEVGTLQPLREVVALAHRHGVPVHSDAVQAIGQVPVDFAASGLDALTLSGHKVGGPLGIGALLARRGLDLTPVLHGGGQERGVRSGTLDTPASRSFAVAVDAAVRSQPDTARRLAGLRDDLVRRVRAAVPGAVLRGPDPTAGPTAGRTGRPTARPTATATGPGGAATGGTTAGPGAAGTAADGPADVTHPERLPANAHFTFPGCEGDSLLYLLDSGGVQCSTGSACQAGVPQPSHVLLAMGIEEHDARGALRFSLGHTSGPADVDALVDVLPGAVARAQAAGLASAGLAGRGTGR